MSESPAESWRGTEWGWTFILGNGNSSAAGAFTFRRASQQRGGNRTGWDLAFSKAPLVNNIQGSVFWGWVAAGRGWVPVWTNWDDWTWGGRENWKSQSDSSPFPPSEGPKARPCRFRYLTKVLKVEAELSLNPAVSSEGNADVFWDDLSTRDACFQKCSPIWADVAPKLSRTCPWKHLGVTLSVCAQKCKNKMVLGFGQTSCWWVRGAP